MFLSTSKKVTGVWNSEVGSRKSMEKAEDIQFHPWNTTHIFTAVKIQLFIFSRLWNTAFLKYALYLINIFLYFITLYIINRGYSKFWNEYAIYFIEWSEKCIFHEWRSHEWNIHFLASRDELNGIFMTKIWIFFLLYAISSVPDFFYSKWRHTRSHIASY